MTQVAKISTHSIVDLPKAISNTDLMSLILKINALLDKFSNSINTSKREQDNVFMGQSKSHKNLKLAEGACILSLAIVSAATGIGGHFASKLLRATLKTVTATTSVFSTGTQSIFGAYETIISAKKQAAQTESSSLKTTDDKLENQVSSNIERLMQLLRQLGSLNHSR